MTPEPTSIRDQRPGKPSALRRGFVAASLVASGVVIGAGGLAFAGGDMPWTGHGGPRVGMIQHVVRRALDSVGATTDQEDRIHDIIAATSTDLQQSKTEREEMRKQVFVLMKAPTIDRAAIEKLRADKITEMDAKSKKIVGALLNAANQLTSEQRVKLVENAQARMSSGWGGWHDGDRMDSRDGFHGDHGMDHGRGPDEDGDHG